MLMWPFKPTNYPKQVLSDKQLQTLNFLDSHLVSNLTDEVTDSLDIFTLVIPLTIQVLPQYAINKFVIANSPKTGGYIARSIALSSQAGNWYLFIGIRNQVIPDATKCIMFMDLLTRTNQARSE